MSKIDLLMTPTRRLIGSAPEDAEKLRTVQPGEVIVARTFSDRDPVKHRKWRAFLQLIADNHPTLRGADDVNDRLKIAVGFVRKLSIGNGVVVEIPKSTSYDECSEADFDQFVRKAEPAAYETLIPDVDRNALEAWLNNETQARGRR